MKKSTVSIADSSHYILWMRDDDGPEGRYCREYTQTVMIGGEQHKAYGRACRRPDGTWEIVK